MNANQEDKLGMYIKCQLYLQKNADALAANTAFASIETTLGDGIDDLVNAESVATRDLTGFTQNKNNLRAELEKMILTAAAACRGYYTTNPDVSKKQQVTLTKSAVEGSRDSDLLVISDKVADIAEPIAEDLSVWGGVTTAFITDLRTKTSTYQDWLQKPRSEEIDSQVAGNTVDNIFSSIDQLLREADDHFEVYQYANELLWQGWKLSRAIDDSGGGSDSSGFVVENITVPANSFVSFASNYPTGSPLYIRVVGSSSIIVCTTAAPTDTCSGGTSFVAQPGVTTKKTVAQLGLDDTKPNIQFTNTTGADIVVRAGFAL